MIRVGILGSTRGTNLISIIDAITHGKLAAQISVVISNKADAGILTLAASHQLTTQFVDAKNCDRESYDRTISNLLREHQIDIIVLIGYMRILSAEFTQTWQHKILNVHPSLLPDFAGLMDLDVHRAVLASGKKQTGCTVHYVTAEVDAGPIILQRSCDVFPTDTPETLKARVQALEGEALVAALRTYKKSSFLPRVGKVRTGISSPTGCD